MTYSQVTTRVQMGDDTAPDGVVSEDTTNGLPSECQSSTDDNEGYQGLIPSQGSDSDENEQQGPINVVTPVALRTRRRLQTVPFKIDGGEGELEQDTNTNNDKELIRQLTTQNKEHQHMIDELSSALKDFLKVQSIVKKTKSDLAMISKQVESQGEFKVTVSKVVKPFTPANNSNGIARDQKSSTNGVTTHVSAREVSGRLKSLEAELNPRSERANFTAKWLQSAIDFQTQIVLNGRKRQEKFMDGMRYNDSQDFADGIPFHTEDPVNYNVDASEEELPRKKSAVHHAFMATPTT